MTILVIIMTFVHILKPFFLFQMKDLNSTNKLLCNSCNKEIDFIWSFNIYNNNSFARLCIDCRNKIMEDLYN